MHPFKQKLQANIKQSNNYLCVGLDPDISKLPDHFSKTLNGLREFLIEVIDVTSDRCIAYKPNISFFEALGLDGLRLLADIRTRIPSTIPVIIDGKRGDIGNTSKMQAKYIFDYFGADATTLHPYMGLDSLAPFFEYKDKYHFVLALTSNPSAENFEKQILKSNETVYERIIAQCLDWQESFGNIGFVVGATQDELPKVRKVAGDAIFLIPGVGKQGGSYDYAIKHGMNSEGLVLINSSRGILYCSKDKDYTQEIKTVIASL